MKEQKSEKKNKKKNSRQDLEKRINMIMGIIVGAACLALIAVLYFSFAAGKPAENSGIDLEKEEKVIVGLKTDKGDITMALYPKLMPVTVDNFVKLVEKSFYNGLTFHRVEDWVIQGGDPKGDGTGGSDQTIKLETNPKLKNLRGMVAMARSAHPDSASSQFYILKKDAAWLDGDYAVFGKVVSGMEIVDGIQIGDKMVEVKKTK